MFNFIYYGEKHDYKVGITGPNAGYSGFMFVDTIDDAKRISRVYVNDFREALKEIADTEDCGLNYLLAQIRILNQE